MPALVASVCITVGMGCDDPAAPAARSTPATENSRTLSREPLEPLPEAPPLGRLEALGQKLFHDKRLSSDASIACSSCHDLERGGDDGRPRSVGVGERLGGINAPTVYNASLNFAQFWDGRAATLEEQAGGPVTNPLEMNSSWPDVLAKLRGDAHYAREFHDLFPDGMTAENIKRSIAAFERTLLTVDSPFDRWVRGDTSALNERQKEGYNLFKAVGCVACHQGRNVGGNMFQRFGVLRDYFQDKGQLTDADYGRFNVTKNESDRFVFRVPSLRNVEHTAPYFHDGSAQTLDQAVQVMAKYQLGRQLRGEEVSMIVAFLRSLSGPGAAKSSAG